MPGWKIHYLDTIQGDFTEFMKKAIYFDTSAINWLYFDNERENVITAIHDYSFVQISVLTFVELGAHPTERDRIGLLNLAKKISRIIAQWQTRANC